MRVLLVRHPEIAKENPDEFVGQRDLPLSAAGLKQIPPLVRRVKENFPAQRLISSPLKRCFNAAVELGKALGLAPETDDRLREIHLGKWEGKSLKQIFEADPKADLFHPPSGESIEKLQKRVYSFWDELAERGAGEKTLVVTHAGVIKVLLLRAQGRPLGEFWDLNVDYASVVEMEVV